MNQIPFDVTTALERAGLTRYWNGLISFALIAASTEYVMNPTDENERLLEDLVRRAENDGRGLNLN